MHDRIEIIAAVTAAALVRATDLPLDLTGAHHNAASGGNEAGIVHLRAGSLIARHTR
jgi:hypothetical protein